MLLVTVLTVVVRVLALVVVQVDWLVMMPSVNCNM